MSDQETIEAEAREEMESLPAIREPMPVTLLGGSSPAATVANAQAVAKALADVIERQNLYKQIRDKKHVLVEGWTLLGSMLGVFPVVEWTRPMDNGWEARVVAKTLTGAEVGAAEAMCSRQENRWKDADDYAVRSMAQTRATSKALRLPLGFVMQLAGYEPTPEPEMPRDGTASVIREEGPGPVIKPRSWTALQELVAGWDEQTNNWFWQFSAAARKLLYGVEDSQAMTPAEKKQLLDVSATAAVALRKEFSGDAMPPPTLEDLRRAFAQALEGQELAIPADSE